MASAQTVNYYYYKSNFAVVNVNICVIYKVNKIIIVSLMFSNIIKVLFTAVIVSKSQKGMYIYNYYHVLKAQYYYFSCHNLILITVVISYYALEKL